MGLLRSVEMPRQPPYQPRTVVSKTPRLIESVGIRRLNDGRTFERG
jgi:hypothetical protein